MPDTPAAVLKVAADFLKANGVTKEPARVRRDLLEDIQADEYPY